MKTARFILVLLIATFSLNSCKKDKKVGQAGTSLVKLSVKIMDGDRELSQNDHLEVFGGFDLEVSLLKFYISNLTLTDDLGESQLVEDIVLFTPMSDNVVKSTGLAIPHNTYQTLSFGFGLDKEQNNSNSSNYDKPHPLAIYYGMYWGTKKYSFLMLQGEAHRNSITYATAMHLGTDSLYTLKTFDFNQDFKVDLQSKTELLLTVDLQSVFQGPAGTYDFSDLSSNPIHMDTKSQTKAAFIIMQNFAAATKLEVVPSAQ